MSDDNNRPGEFRYWTQSIDGMLYGCWYRLRSDGQIAVFARGHHVVLPLDAIALLPESVARALLSQLRQHGIPEEPVGIAEPQMHGDITARDIESGGKDDPSGMATPANTIEAVSLPAGWAGAADVTQIASVSAKASDQAPSWDANERSGDRRLKERRDQGSQLIRRHSLDVRLALRR